MTETYDIVISGGDLATHETSGAASIGVRDGRIAAIGDVDISAGAHHIDAQGLTILPGVIDTQVHFREPGLTHKEDLQSGSLAAVMGGVVGVFEMPNTKPPTTDAAALNDKVKAGHHRMHCDFAFYVGATPQNAATLPDLEKLEGVCGVKVFMGSSTGQLLVPDDESLGQVLKHITRRAAFHSEDEFRLRERRPLAQTGKVETHPIWRDDETAISSTRRLIALARKYNKQIHVLHITTAEEMKMLAENRDIASVEVTPQHLTLAAPDAYDRLGTFAQMNPPIRGEAHRAALWAALDAGIVDVIGSDHAPHTIEEKQETYPHSPAGLPGVQTLLPLMLHHHNAGKLSLQRLVDLTSYSAKRLFNLKDKGEVKVGAHADFTFVDLKRQETIKQEWLASRCGWSPFTDMKVNGWAVGTMIRGQRVMWEGELTAPSIGEVINFN
ncbi:MAG: dihydroorotase [Alphaproteobacteria bacterium]|nr:dihydroorotase [Alphaproteobacteria bacterium]MBE8220007.1 dihydroorotase [Alphaproteobacteria bacterium]